MPTKTENARTKFRKENGLAWCSKCKVDLPQSEFDPSPGRRPLGLSSRCKACELDRKANLAKRKYWSLSQEDRYTLNRKQNLKRKFGISVDTYNKMLAEQGGVCAICRKPESVKHHATNEVQPLVVDHDHNTGGVRGLLCTRCNKGIGLLGDDVDALKNAVSYLETYAPVLVDNKEVEVSPFTAHKELNKALKAKGHDEFIRFETANAMRFTTDCLYFDYCQYDDPSSFTKALLDVGCVQTFKGVEWMGHEIKAKQYDSHCCGF